MNHVEDAQKYLNEHSTKKIKIDILLAFLEKT